MKEFDRKTIQRIAIFENFTGTEVRDCVSDEKGIYFLVENGKAGLAIGKRGKLIKTAQRMFGKEIRVFEYDKDPERFIKNLIPEAEKINVNKKSATINIDSRKRGKVIGKGGSKIKKIRELIKRNLSVEKLKIMG